mgnify:CR=1 FL=1
MKGRFIFFPVKFKQECALSRFFLRLMDAGVMVRNFRAECARLESLEDVCIGDIDCTV